MRFALRFLALTLLLFAVAIPDASAKPRPRAIQHAESEFGFCANPPDDADFTPAPTRSVTTMDEEWGGCRCAYYTTVCAPYVRCYTNVECRMNYVCPPTGDCTEEQVCENVVQCDYDWYCWSECGRIDCYI